MLKCFNFSLAWTLITPITLITYQMDFLWIPNIALLKNCYSTLHSQMWRINKVFFISVDFKDKISVKIVKLSLVECSVYPKVGIVTAAIFSGLRNIACFVFIDSYNSRKLQPYVTFVTPCQSPTKIQGHGKLGPSLRPSQSISSSSKPSNH